MTVTNLISAPASVSTGPTALVPASAPQSSGGLSFSDILNTVNPLQHIPVISNLYRAATGTQISAASQVAGDTLFGALLPGGAIAGLASSLANVAVKEVTGKDIGQIVVGAVSSTSAASGSAAPTAATPLIPTAATPASIVAAQAASSIPSIPLTRNDRSTNEYQRAQALDALNSRLLKMTS